MIRAVADTHALIWAVYGDPRLSPAARAVFATVGADQIALSAISLAEIVYLEEKGRLPAGTLARIKTEMTGPEPVFVEVPVTSGVVDAMARIPRADVPDLPDRIIAGTALHLGVPAVSRDRKIRTSDVPTIW